MIQISLFWHGYKVEIILKNSWNCEVRRNLFTKTCLTNKYFSRVPYFVILAWVQNWNYFEKLMKLGSLPNSFHKNMSHTQLHITWSIFCDSSMGTKLKYFWITYETLKSDRIFSQKHISRTNTFHVTHISWFWNRYKIKIFLKNSWNCEVRQNLFTKTCLTNRYFSRDPYFVILALAQSWNIIEKLMKVWIEPEIFHNNMCNEQLLFTWSTFRDSSMGTKLKLFWITHQTGNPLNSFHKNMSHKQLLLMWSTIFDSSMWTKLKYFVKLVKLLNCKICLDLFTKTFLTNNYFSRDPHFVILA